MFRAAFDVNPQICILSIDGIGACDNSKRASMLKKLHALPTASAILPFVRTSCAAQTEYLWTDDKEEQLFLSILTKLPDLQCAWQLPTRCAILRSSYWLGILPPSASQAYAQGTDDAT